MILNFSNFNRTEVKNKFLYLILIYFILWFNTPAYGQSFIWLTGSANYLWTSVIALLYIILLSLVKFLTEVKNSPTFIENFNVIVSIILISSVNFSFFSLYFSTTNGRQIFNNSLNLGSVFNFGDNFDKSPIIAELTLIFESCRYISVKVVNVV